MNPFLGKTVSLTGLVVLIVFMQRYQPQAVVTASKEVITTASLTLPTPTLWLIFENVVRSAANRATPTLMPLLTTPAKIATPIFTPAPVVHIVEAGDMPLSIAAEYDITVEKLLAVNNINDPTTLQIGQELLIPITATPIRATSTPAASPTPLPTPIYHIIEEGEIPLSIANQYDITVETLLIANGIVDPTSLQIGQELIIPPDKGSPLGVPTKLHQITPGDTLLTLAAQYGSTLEDILATNPDLEPTSLQIGQQVVIPITQPQQAQRPANATAFQPPLPRVTAPDPSLPGLVAMERQMIDAVNAQREAYGLPSYTADAQLGLIARAHAQDMVARGYFSHVSLEGLNLRDRLSSQGFELNWVGENIIRSVRPAEETVTYALTWFMNDRPHRANLLHDQYTRMGVGVAQESSGWYILVQVFAGDS